MRLPALTNRSVAIGSLLVAAWRHGMLPVPSNPVVVSLRDGRCLELDLRHHTQRKMAVDLFEGPESRAVCELLGPGDTVVDVGAHVGWVTTLASVCIGKEGHVWAFEPYPESRARLVQNIKLNRSANVTVVPVAVGATHDQVDIGLQDEDSGGVTTVRAPVGQAYSVPQVHLDDVIPRETSVALLKIDVEGGELAVLTGAAETLQRTHAVLIELNREALSHADTTPEFVADRLFNMGFTRLRVITRRPGKLRPSLGGRQLHGLPDFANLIATRG